MSAVKAFSWWQCTLFGVCWGLLLVPAYFAAFGAWLIGSMLPEFHAPVDIVLTLIMGVSLFVLMLIAVYTGWHFLKRSRSFSRLLGLVLAGVLLVPLVSATGALVSYTQLSESWQAGQQG
ncbi:MAG TPA: hypothetical protein PLB10_07265 [Thiolinea sp.]|nr:hypothetical protein [Thiolinea sp.]